MCEFTTHPWLRAPRHSTFVGQVTFSYLVVDSTYPAAIPGLVGSVPGLVTINVVPNSELCITARDDVYSTPFNTPLTLGAGQAITANDSSTCAQTPALRVVSNGQPAAGSGSVGAVAPDGTFTFVPAPGFTGAAHACVATAVCACSCGGQQPVHSQSRTASSPPALLAGTAVFPYNVTDDSTGKEATAIVLITVQPPGASCLAARDDTYQGAPRGCRSIVAVLLPRSGASGSGRTLLVTPLPCPLPSPLTHNPHPNSGTYNTPFSPPAGALILANDTSGCSPSPQLRVLNNTNLIRGSGSVSGVSPTGNFTFTPAPGFFGA